MPDHEQSPALQEWINARQRELEFANAAKQNASDRLGQQANNYAAALRDIAETGSCGHGINLQNAVDYLRIPKEERTDDDRELFTRSMDNLSEVFGPDNAVAMYRAWERRPQTPTEE